MDLFWIYEIPVWLSFCLVVAAITVLAVAGIFICRPFARKVSNKDGNSNDLISYFLSAIGVFYGITLGLIAAGTWQNFNDADDKVNLEAASVAALYRDVSAFQIQDAAILKSKLKSYVFYVIDTAWQLHRQGIAQTRGTELLTDFQKTLYNYEPHGSREEAIFTEALKQFNSYIQLRRQRLQCVNNGIVAVVWYVIIFGAVLTLITCCLFHFVSLRLHIVMNIIIGITIGSLIHVIIMLDNPFRGNIAITPEAFENVYHDLMMK